MTSFIQSVLAKITGSAKPSSTLAAGVFVALALSSTARADYVLANCIPKDLIVNDPTTCTLYLLPSNVLEKTEQFSFPTAGPQTVTLTDDQGQSASASVSVYPDPSGDYTVPGTGVGQPPMNIRLDLVRRDPQNNGVLPFGLTATLDDGRVVTVDYSSTNTLYIRIWNVFGTINGSQIVWTNGTNWQRN